MQRHRNRFPARHITISATLALLLAATLAPAQSPAPAPAPATAPVPATAPAPVASPATSAETAQPAKPDQPTNLSPDQQRRDQIAADSDRLFQLARELKIEMDKSTKDTLSLTVIKKAEEVEKLARKVREELKTSLSE